MRPRTVSLCLVLHLVAALGAESASAQCSCVNDLPPFTVVLDSMKIETGGPPTEMLGVQSIMDVTVVHANEFILNEPFTITHVCVATDPQNDELEPRAEIRIKLHDYVMDAPMEQPLATVEFTVEKDELGYEEQVIALDFPLVVTQHFWVEVAYFGVHGGFSHQGARPHPPYNTTRSFVRVTESGQWFDYEETNVYPNRRAVIRVLELGPEPPPSCDLIVSTNGAPHTGEDGTIAGISLQLLGGPPSTPVVVAAHVGHRGAEGVILDPVKVFDLFNWTEPQTMTVVGLDDPYLDGDQPYSVWFQLFSQDPCYDGLIVPPFHMVNDDDEDGLGVPFGLPHPGRGSARPKLVLGGISGSTAKLKPK